MKTQQLTHSIVQYPTDLIFALTDYDVRGLLTVLQTHTLSLDGYTIDFAIIGESHCVTILSDSLFARQEVLACTDIPAILQANSHKFAKLEAYQYQDIGYQARVWFTDTPQVWKTAHDGMLKLEFPETHGQIPFTQVEWQIINAMVHWRTTHVYPLQSHTTYVYTESYFDLNGRKFNE